MPDLYQELDRLADSDMYPFHMPGHKRNLESTPLKGAFRCDITEIDDFDNLHAANGIILEGQKRAAKLYGSDETFYVVNGSTAGVLSAVSSVASYGDTILASRGSHRSLYNAAYLKNLNIKYLPYSFETEYEIPTATRPEDIKEALDDSISAVFITSPTYEGKCADVRAIAELCHQKKIPLIVDAAHGAHFGLSKLVPENAVAQGADIVIHSLHKTLPSMTQTALLHVNGELVDRNRVKRSLSIYQSSSPSYVLMSSIDLCIKEMEEKGDEFIERLVYFRNKIQEETKYCQNVKVLGKEYIDDPSKVLICSDVCTMTGQNIYDILREEYALQLEMAAEKYALAIITGWDREDGIDRLIKAICEIDARVSSSFYKKSDRANRCCIIPEKVYSIAQGWDMEKELVLIEEVVGRVSGEFVNLYPPGIPILAPGERFSEEIVENLKGYLQEGLNLQGVQKIEKQGIIKRGFICVKQK
ncbi:aminotransferase class I/II-fold pyridoxal phosphate-dependent enzyme [Butyrivibrio proteoclasticus]|uniref:aminotransferase class I/II-fold pyridoxal phosphate-dependent enzyme n=1 Tax=Butyrivibrio proteoclasticus TaxID=43305 RepID=UPI00047B627B|nr:aminotransferase class I/II-fold pyridoxal phosphate-dependent enzyme [Butyrivibrio proteoclasticus]